MITTKLDMRELERIQRELIPKARAVVDKTAFDVQARAANNAPIETGALASSIYTVTERSNGHATAVAAARARNPKGKVVSIPTPQNDLEANVGPSMEYGIYQELGTARMPAQPFLIPAIEKIRPYWRKAWKAMFKGFGK